MPTITRTRRPVRGFSFPTALPTTPFSEFRTRYTDECLCFLARNTQTKVAGILDSIEAIAKPQTLEDLDAAAISRWAAKRKTQDGVSDATLKSNLSHVQSALSWAFEHGLIPAIPKIRTPPRAKSQKLMKGRAVTPAEFERMLACCPDEPLRFLIRGLWTSGLRLSEALALSWDAGSLCVDLPQEVFRIPAEFDKGNCDRLLPMADEFIDMLKAVPESERTGPVFKVAYRRLEDASRAITAIGEAAGIIVDAKTGKFASAHDLRRSFGERWAARVMPADLLQIMRHESIETTMRYYVGKNAKSVRERMREAVNSSAS